jgi:hypothetical protein
MHRNTLPALCGVLAAALTACDQKSQNLPFDLDPLSVTQQSIGPEGGLLSHPAGISIEFPRGALARTTKVSVTGGLPLSDFPGNPKGEILNGTYFNVTPAQLELRKPISVDIAIAAAALAEGDRARLGFAIGLEEAEIRTEGVSFDITSGILRGSVNSLGAIAAVVSDNVIIVSSDPPPVLAGGTFVDATASGVSSAATRLDSGFRSRSAGDPFLVVCSYTGTAPRCLDSGAVAM